MLKLFKPSVAEAMVGEKIKNDEDRGWAKKQIEAMARLGSRLIL